MGLLLTNVQVLELEQCVVQLEQCQLVRYNNKTGTLGKPFDEPRVSAGCSVCVVFVCVHACMCVCVHLSVSVSVSCVFVCMHVCCVCVRACMEFFLHVCVCVYVKTCFSSRNVYMQFTFIS